MSGKIDLFDTTAGKLSQLRALVAVIESADLSNFDNRIKGSYFWLALDLVTECEDLLMSLDKESNDKIKKLEVYIEELQENIKKAGGGL